VSHALERVKIPRLGRSVSAAALFALALPVAIQAQDARPDAGTHTVKRGDTLWDLAQTYLGDAYLWPEIYRLNTDQIDDPHWIYPGEVLRLPGRGVAAPAVAEGAPAVEQPRRSNAPTVFASRTLLRARPGNQAAVVPPRVPLGDVIRAPYFDRANGPRTSGRIMFSADIPGIERPRGMSNYQLYDRLLLVPPAGSLAAPRDRFVAYTLSDDVEDVGTVVVPSAVLEVVRAPQNGEAAIVRVVSLFTQLNADDHVVPLDTTGAGVTAAPRPFPSNQLRSTTVRSIQRAAVLPSLSYYVLFDLAARDGMKIGDEVLVYREREVSRGDDNPILPEVPIATGQVVRVTPFGATARILSQEQPAIRVGERVRVTARMP
jgi:LysM repeat protein